MLLRGYGMDTKGKEALPLEEEGRRLFPIGIGGSHDLHDLTWLEREAL